LSKFSLDVSTKPSRCFLQNQAIVKASTTMTTV